MKTSFDFSLTGKDWWGPFLGFWVIFLAIYIPNILLSKLVSVTEHTGLYILLVVLFIFLLVVVQSIFTIIILRIVLPKLSFGGKSFGFNGSIGTYLGMNLLGMLLSVVTLFVYMPWYTRKIIAYLASETTWDGSSPEFLGKGGKLFVYFLLGMWVPIIVVSVLVGLIVAAAAGSGMGSSTGTQLTTTIITLLIVFIIFVPLFYLMMKWYLNVAFRDLKVGWKARFWPSCGFILGQLLLTVITLGIYGPAAILRCYAYFAPDVVLFRGDLEVGWFSFEGPLGRGFGLIWGQSLLCLITLGVYIPWAYSRIGSWIAASTYLERNT
jgi:uncharacterized membrane protein YjgN (DUF898 family)